MRTAKTVTEERHQDIMPELDVQCQKLTERTLRKSDPACPVLVEEGVAGSANSKARRIEACTRRQFWPEELCGFEAYRLVVSNGLVDARLPQPK